MECTVSVEHSTIPNMLSVKLNKNIDIKRSIADLAKEFIFERGR